MVFLKRVSAGLKRNAGPFLSERTGGMRSEKGQRSAAQAVWMRSHALVRISSEVA